MNIASQLGADVSPIDQIQALLDRYYVLLSQGGADLFSGADRGMIETALPNFLNTMKGIAASEFPGYVAATASVVQKAASLIAAAEAKAQTIDDASGPDTPTPEKKSFAVPIAAAAAAAYLFFK